MLEEKRNKHWESLFAKYEERGKTNSADCSFAEVNYKLFAKPRLLKRLRPKKKPLNKCTDDNITCTANSSCDKTESSIDVDISDIIDNDVHEMLFVQSNESKENNSISTDFTNEDILKETQNYLPTKVIKHNDKILLDKENHNTATNVSTPTDQSSLEDIIHFVEVDLKSNLKEMIIYRSECKILETDDYHHWHNCTKNEMKRLRKYITRDELKEYMRHCNKQDINLKGPHDEISSDIKNNLKKLLVKREFARNDTDKYLKYCDKIYQEWPKIVNEMPLDYAILYASCVINSIRERKSRVSLSAQYQINSGSTVELQKEPDTVS